MDEDILALQICTVLLTGGVELPPLDADGVLAAAAAAAAADPCREGGQPSLLPWRPPEDGLRAKNCGLPAAAAAALSCC